MNIFKILSSYDGTIKEPNISAFISYLINPYEDHGLKHWFLFELIKRTASFDLLDEPLGEFRSKIGSRDYVVKIRPEFPVDIEFNEKYKRRDIDILIEIFKNDHEQPTYAICLENKINEASIADQDQLADEIQGLKQLYSSEEEKTKIGLIYLIPKFTPRAELSYNKVDCNKKVILWSLDDDSISSILRKILRKESEGFIDPLCDTIKHTLRAFLAFIENQFRNNYEYRSFPVEKQKYGKPVIEYIKEIWNDLKFNEKYKVKEIKDSLSNKIHQMSGKKLDLSTRNCQMYQVIVNDMNRTNYAVKNPEEPKYNLFFYPDEADRSIIEKFDFNDSPEDINIYYKSDGKRQAIALKDLRELGV